MNVLSTASLTPAALHTAATAPMSHSLSSGFVGVSTQHSLVLPGLMAARIFSGSRGSA
jgi:hypothetical protein